jgi:putative membrane protein
MMQGASPSSSPSSDEQRGEQVYNQLTSGQTTCAKLTDDDFDVLGDFYMARMMGSSAHSTMDQQMAKQMGETANTQMHVAMAKRLSGCDTNATYPAAAAGNYPYLAGMTGMMGSGGMMGGNGWGWNSMMGGYGNASSWWGGMLVFLLILVAVALLHAYLVRHRNLGELTPLETLKARYAKGEIDKKEYDEKRKDLE